MDDLNNRKPKFTPPPGNNKVLQYQKDGTPTIDGEVFTQNKPEFLDKADEIVYARGRKSFDDVRKKVMKTDKQKFIWSPKFDDKKLDWEVDKDPLKKSFSFFSMGLFAFSMVLLVSAMAYAYYSFSTGGYAVRQDKIELSLDIPTITSAGQDMGGQIVVGNSNRTIFKDAYVVLDVLEHEGEPVKTLNQIQIGDVDVGNKVYKNISLNLSGLEGENKKVTATLFYKVPQTNSTFEKSVSQDVLITKSPVTMSITGPQSLSVSQDGEYIVSVRGISKVIPALLLTLDVPKQMKIIKTNTPAVAKNTYSLGAMNEGDERVFKFTGSFQDAPEIGDKFTINIKAGAGEDAEVKSYFAESTYGVNLAQNPIKIQIFSGNSTGNKIFFSGKQPKARVVVTNQSSSRVVDGSIEIRFSGGLLLPKAVSVDGAVYDSTRFIATADGALNPQLKEIDPGATVEFPIEFSELADEKTVTGRNLNIAVAFTSKTEGSEGKPTTDRISTTLTPQEATNVALSTLYFSGAFKNSGPMPAVVGQKTTYTVNLNVETNSGFTNGKFIVPLPPYVEFVKGLDNTVIYNKDQRTVTWNVGNMSKATSTAFGVSKKDTAIQVSILPNPDQARQAPSLTQGARFEAILPDKSDTTINATDATINISQDPKYELGKGYESVSE
jgi:hypothetical protein